MSSRKRAASFSGLRNAAALTPWLRLAAFFSLIGFALLFYSLGRPGLQSRARDFLLIPAGDSNRVVLALKLLESREGVYRHQISMESDAANLLLDSPRIGLLMVCNWTPGEIISGEIVFSEKTSGKITARYKAKKGGIIRENRELEFKRIPTPSTPTPERQTVAVDIVSRGSPDLALIGQFSEVGPPAKFLWLPATSPLGKAGVASVCGVYETGESGEAFSKARLLAYMWGFGTGGGWIVNCMAAAAALAWLFGVLALTRIAPDNGLYPEGLLTALGAGSLFFSTALVLIILVPPFQAPDEPDHFLAYSKLNNRPALASEALRFSNAAHFERLKFRTDEKFSTLDVGEPMREKWASHIEATDPNRSPITRSIWSIADQLLKTGEPGTALLGLRFINILFVTLCLIAALSLAAWALQPERLSILMAAPVILTPSIAFFSVGLSNYPFVVAGYIFQASALGTLWAQTAEADLKPRLQAVSGILCGTGIVMAIGAGDNGFFCIAFWALMIPAFWLLRGMRAVELSLEISRWRAFFIAFAAAMVFGWFVSGLAGSDFDVIPRQLPPFLKTILSGAGPWHLGVKTLLSIGFMISVTALSLLMLCAGCIARRAGLHRQANRVVVALILFLVCFVVFAKSSRIPEGHAISTYVYALKVLHSFFEGFGPGKSDWLVAQSFWGVFGWLDTPLPEMLIDALKYTAAAGILLLFYLSLKANKYLSGAGFLAANIISLSAFIVCIAAGYYSALNGVTGRYLIGPYLLLLVPAYEGFRRLLDKIQAPGTGCGFLHPAACLACMLVQCTAWMTIIHRYF